MDRSFALRILKFAWCLTAFMSVGLCAFAQQLLQQKMTVGVQRGTIREVLNQMEMQGMFYFSYNSEVVPDDKVITVSYRDQTVEAILNGMLGPGFRYQVADNHIIIKSGAGAGIVISGRVVDMYGEPVEYVSVYERNLKVSTISDQGGHFRLPIRQQQPAYEVSFSRQFFLDTVLHIQSQYAIKTPVVLRSDISTLDSVSFSGIQEHWLAKRMMGARNRINSINLGRMFDEQPFQLSVLPGVSSKNRLSSQQVNKFSFSLLGGYAGGVNGFELGTVFNIVQGDMRYSQTGGVFNIVGGNMEGVQIGGIYNYVHKHAEGVQISGIFNHSRSLKGLQLAGISNWSCHKKDSSIVITAGMQIGGIFNRTNTIQGMQIAGITNWNYRNGYGWQIAGIVSKNRHFRGAQISGLMNYAQQRSKGVHIAGLLNLSRKSLNGVQIAGLFNYASVVKGVQIGLVNVADTFSGVAVGLINVARKGKHSLNVTAMEWQPFNLAYKSGTDRFYSIIHAGANPVEGYRLLSFGYGLGHRLAKRERYELIQELSCHGFYAGNWDDLNSLARYQLLYQYNLSRSVSFYAGPAVTVVLPGRRGRYEGYGFPSDNGYPSVMIGNNLKFWIGWTAGISLF